MAPLKRIKKDPGDNTRRQTMAWLPEEWDAIEEYARQAGVTPHGAVRELMRTNPRIGLKSLLTF